MTKLVRLFTPFYFFIVVHLWKVTQTEQHTTLFFYRFALPHSPFTTVCYWFAKFVLQLFGGLYDCSFQALGTKVSASITSDIKAMFFRRQNDPPSPIFLFHYLPSPWLQEAARVIASSHTVRPSVSFLPALPPTAWTFPAIVARHSRYLVVKGPFEKFPLNKLWLLFITLDSEFSHPAASCWHLFEDLVWSRIKQGWVEECPPITTSPHVSWLVLLLLLWGLSGSVTSQCILCCLLHVFAGGALCIYSIPTQPGNQAVKGHWRKTTPWNELLVWSLSQPFG